MEPYDLSVFVNCPFDDDYKPIFEALVFAVHDCGFVARCALEVTDTAQVRIDRLFDLIEACRYGLHDISRTELDDKNHLPRFNMPLELGMFLGARRFGAEHQRHKACLVLDHESYRYQKFCSDIAGQDVKAYGVDRHGDTILAENWPLEAIRIVRNWLRSVETTPDVRIPSGGKIADRYVAFLDDLPAYCEAANLDLDDLTYSDYTALVVEWLRQAAGQIAD